MTIGLSLNLLSFEESIIGNLRSFFEFNSIADWALFKTFCLLSSFFLSIDLSSCIMTCFSLGLPRKGTGVLLYIKL